MVEQQCNENCENSNIKQKQDLSIKELEIKNQQLKALLKRCRDFINYEVPDHCIDDILLDKIDEALK